MDDDLLLEFLASILKSNKFALVGESPLSTPYFSGAIIDGLFEVYAGELGGSIVIFHFSEGPPPYQSNKAFQIL